MGCLPQVWPKTTCQISKPSRKQGGLASAKAIRRSGKRWTSRKAGGLSEEAKGELERRVLGLIVVLGIEVFDLCCRNVQLGLRQLHDGGQAQIVPSLRQLHGQRGLTKKLRGDIDALIGVGRAGPSHA